MIHTFKSFNESSRAITMMTKEMAKEMLTYLDAEGEHALVTKYKNVVTDSDISGIIGAWATSNKPLENILEDYWSMHTKIYKAIS